MAEENEDPSEKTEDPSQYRIDEFRKKGEVASSKELTSVLLLSGILLCLTISSAFMFEVLSEFLEWLYGFELSKFYTKENMVLLTEKSAFTILKMLGPIFLTSICLGYLTQFMQFGFIFSMDAIKWDINKVNPLNGFKRLFSKKTLFETFKGLLKFVLVMSITYYVMNPVFHKLVGFLDSDLSTTLSFSKMIFSKLIFSVLIGLLIMALIDFSWEKYTYSQKLKMTKKQARDEMKEKDGNPEIKQRIKTIQREIARKRMMKEVKNADVIVTNPTHISIAIKYDHESMHAPSVVAKGADHLALKIRELAKENDVPMVENVPLARALYGTVKLGDFVPRNLYKAVAEILAYVYKIKRKKKAVS